jgi:hypothetical protein
MNASKKAPRSVTFHYVNRVDEGFSCSERIDLCREGDRIGPVVSESSENQRRSVRWCRIVNGMK